MDQILAVASGHRLTITINRPERRNSIGFTAIRGIRDAVRSAANDADISVIVLTGAGDKAFCSGADLSEIAEGTAAGHEARGELAGLFRDLRDCGKPSIARVRGYALAGGFGLAMACDLVVAADDAQFGTPEINVGLWPYMITVPILRALSPRRALELMVTGRRLDAAEALDWGLINRVVSVEELDAAVDDLATTVGGKSPLIMSWGLQSFRRACESSEDEALDYLQAMLSLTAGTNDAAEGVAAFLEKRKPLWSGT
ncbi:MAG: enoyl-CoA hydratase/isomerase family protein [Actinobacteria bacterium]|nr:enoyl-CoA hydratase/isomerase family protein [Actinomycetota bacterium]MCB9388377.1 enoyl-CoA hydratase/isomerase family protein [Acidimicrobiia bacterium]